MGFDTTSDIFDTPRLRYPELQKNFRLMYLKPSAWDHEYGFMQSVQAYHDLLYYLEKTEEFRCQDVRLSTYIPTDNVNLVFHDLPFSLKDCHNLR